jgi:tRNA (mo5U34)-methyltransferase
MPGAVATADLREAVAGHDLWYHTIELGPEVVTPGWFDLRPVVDRIPWPDVRGKRCLDVGTWDGFWAFELERRGASEVVATDIRGPDGWDLAAANRAAGVSALAAMAGETTGRGFEIARRALGSSVERMEINVYDLTPERVGEFDVVVCGSLLLHLRDPVRALEAIRGVCRERLLSAETVSPGLSAIHRRLPLAVTRGGTNGQWWVPNSAGHRRLVTAGGFRIERSSRLYAIPLGVAHPSYRERRHGWRNRLLTRLITGGSGVPHAAVLAAPEPGVDQRRAA